MCSKNRQKNSNQQSILHLGLDNHHPPHLPSVWSASSSPRPFCTLVANSGDFLPPCNTISTRAACHVACIYTLGSMYNYTPIHMPEDGLIYWLLLVHALCNISASLYIALEVLNERILHIFIVGLAMNVALIVLALFVEVALKMSIKKRLIIWLLYYEFTVPLVFIFIQIIHLQHDASHVFFFFLFFVGAPLSYFAFLTFICFIDFMSDESLKNKL